MLRRASLSVIIVILLAAAIPVLALADEQNIDAQWTVNVHTRADGSLSAVGTMHLHLLDSGERHAWRITGVEHRTDDASDASRLDFLRLVGTPLGPARSATPDALDIQIEYTDESRTPDAAGRVMVKFTWTVGGVGTFAKDGTILIKGKKIQLYNQSVFRKSTGDES